MYVQRFTIIGTQCLVYEAWEPYNGHSTMTYHDEYGKLGKVGRRPLPANIAAMPRGEERSKAVAGHQAFLNNEALTAIHNAFPHTRNFEPDCLGDSISEIIPEKRHISEWVEVAPTLAERWDNDRLQLEVMA